MCIGQQHLRLTIDGDGRRLNHGRRTATAAPRRCGATAGGDKHCYEDAKSNYQRAFKKHCIFSLNVSTIGTRVSSLEERSHQNSPLQLTFAAGYNLLFMELL